MKKFIYALAIFLTITNTANAQEKPVNLICKMENGNEWQVKIDLTENYLQMYPLDKMKIEISENEVTHEVRLEGKIMAAIKIERYSLKISMFSALAKTNKDSGWTYGKCELAKKQF